MRLPPFVNSVGPQYIASRAQIEQACDPPRQHGSSVKKTIGLSNVDLCDSYDIDGVSPLHHRSGVDGAIYCYVEHNGHAHLSIPPGSIAECLSIS